MKINKLWIPMIIFGIIGGIAKLCDTVFNVKGIGFFVDSGVCAAIFVVSIIVVWLIGIMLLIADMRVEVELTPPKSRITGFFGFVSAVSLLGTGILSLFSLGSSESMAGSIIMCLLSLAGGAILLYESCISFTGHNGMIRFPLAGLLLPAWACGRLITLFIEYSKVSIHATEMFDVISVTFLMLFLFYQAMLFAEIGPRASVRRTTLYGICYIMCGLITTIDIMIKMFSPTPDASGIDTLVIEPTIGRIMTCIGDLSFVAYTAAFVISNAKNAVIERLDGEDDDEDDPEFLGSISSERPAKKDETPKETGSKKKNSGKVKSSGMIRTVEDDDASDSDKTEDFVLKFDKTDSLDFSNLNKAISEKSKSEINDDISSSDESPMIFEDISESTGEQDEIIEPLPMTFESIMDSKPAPMTFESISENESASITIKNIAAEYSEEIEQEPQEEEFEVPSYTDQKAEKEEYVDDSFTDFDDEDIFADENSQNDYDEIFRMLDEMDTDK